MLFLFLGCFADPPPAEPVPESVSPPTEMVMLTGALKTQLCALPCSGPLTSLQIWRESSSGPLALITHSGDLEACSHPPTTWVDTAGAVVLIQEERPVGPAEAEALAAERDALSTGLVKAERLSCEGLTDR